MIFRQHIEQLPEKTHVLQLLYPSTIPQSISTRTAHHPHPIYRGIDDTQGSGIDDSSPTQRNPQPKPPNPMQFKPANNRTRQSTCLQHQISQIRKNPTYTSIPGYNLKTPTQISIHRTSSTRNPTNPSTLCLCPKQSRDPRILHQHIFQESETKNHEFPRTNCRCRQ